MTFEAFFTEDAVRDLDTLLTIYADNNSGGDQDKAIEQLRDCVDRLIRAPDQYAVPRELGNLGIQEYRELSCGNYRLIYRQTERKLFIYLIADARLEIQTLLARRLLCI